jgi:hypothetical protein
MAGLLAGSALDEEFHAAIEGLFFFFSEITRRQFAPQTMVVQTFAAKPVLAARGVRAGAVLGVDAHAGTLVDFSHENLQA